jgi:lipopolysaccharide export system protein LptA
VAVGAAALLAGVAAASQPVVFRAHAAPARAVQLVAGEITIDAATGDGEAVGGVRLTDGRTTAVAARARLARGAGLAVLSGGARVVAPQGTLAAREITAVFTRQAITQVVARGGAVLDAEELRLRAPEITIVPAREEVTADGGVALTVPPDVTASAERVAYRRAAGQMVLEGDARVVTRDGHVAGTRVEADRRARHVRVSGPVRAVYGQLQVESAAALLDGQAQVAVFTGQVRAADPHRRLVTERLVVWYTQRRLLAEGPTRIVVEPAP